MQPTLKSKYRHCPFCQNPQMYKSRNWWICPDAACGYTFPMQKRRKMAHKA
uniref:Uncharacterized protein n=1 Tax=viral metagenome TaxID=1070528 RepID=A0A6M3Y289_9ZZZZ